jgi:hypothetical protein
LICHDDDLSHSAHQNILVENTITDGFGYSVDIGGGRKGKRGKPGSGPKGTRTLDLFNAIEALSQLSYRPAGGAFYLLQIWMSILKGYRHFSILNIGQSAILM